MPASPPTSRVIAILEALAGPHDGLAASALARSLGLSTSTVSLILATLRESNYVERRPDRSYQLGPGLMRLLTALQGRFPILSVANDELAHLAAKFACGASMAHLGADGQEVVLTRGATEPLGIRPGVHLPFDPPHGTIVMAWRSPEEIEHWLSAASSPVRETYRTGLLQVRLLGFAVYGIPPNAESIIDQLRTLLGSIQTEHNARHLHEQLDQLAAAVGSLIYTKAELEAAGRKAVSHIIAPVFAADRQPRYLVSLHLMRESVSAQELTSCVDALLKSARILTNQIGGQAPA